MEHTPGPWTVDLDTGEIESKDLFAIGTFYGAQDYPGCGKVIEECQANGRLIAAAPDLLDGCQAAVNWLMRVKSDHPELYTSIQRDTGMVSLLYKLTDAIIKAEGKE